MELTIVRQTSYVPERAADYDELLASLHMRPTWRHEPANIQILCESQTSNFYLAMLAKRAVGMATLVKPFDSLSHTTAVFEDVATHREFRGIGIGGRLVRHLEEEALALGATRIELHSREARTDAQRLYRKHGFEEVETTLFRKNLAP